jgi:ribosomal protein S18 acetylase RimI-like enzyme
MFVRTAGARDVENVRTLLVETWRHTYDPIYGAEKVKAINDDWHSIASLKANVDRPNAEFLLADDGTQIAGMAFATTVEDGKTVMLRQLYVRPSMQGRGVGGLLLDEIESCFPDAEKVRLEVEERNERAVTFYVAQGFKKVGRTENCGEDRSGIPAAVYERPIAWAD